MYFQRGLPFLQSLRLLRLPIAPRQESPCFSPKTYIFLSIDWPCLSNIRPHSFCIQYLIWRRSSTIYGLYIRSLSILILCGINIKPTVLFPHFSYKVLGVLTRLPKGPKIEAAKGSGGHPKQSTFCAQFNSKGVLLCCLCPGFHHPFRGR